MNQNEKEVKSMSFKDRIKFFQNQGKEEKKTKEEIKVTSGGSSIQERIRKMKEEQDNKNKSKVQEKTEYNFNISKKANNINANVKPNKPEIKPKIKEVKKFQIIPGKHTLIEEHGKIKVYNYPNDSFSREEINYSKIILILGNARNDFINTFINIYSNISFNEENRLSIVIKENKDIMSYDIVSRTIEKNYNVKIFSIPPIEKDNTRLKKNLLELFRIKIPRNKINLICFAFDENKIELDEYEKIFYRFLVNLFNLKDKLLFLISSNQNNNNDNYSIHQFLNSNNYYIGEYGNFKPEYITINNKAIFENDEKNWKILTEKMQIIKDKIKSSKSEELTKDKLSIIELIFFEGEEKFVQRFTNLKKREKILIIYYLVDLQENIGKDFSKYC